MARDENMPFQLGTTYFGGDATAIDVTVATNLEGQEYWVEDDDYTAGTVGSMGSRSGRKRKVRIVRNMNATTALAKEMHKLQTGGSATHALNGRIDGKTTSAATKGYPVDEFLGSAGCVQYDLCYVVVDGLAVVKTDTAGDTNISLGAVVVAGATTAGRVVDQDTTATGSDLFNQIQNAIGRAAVAVNGTSTEFTVDVGATHR